MRSAIAFVTTSLLAVLALTAAYAKDEKHDEPVAQADPAPVSTEPQQTSASFGDWVVRCDHPAPGAQGVGKRVCEAAQSLIVKGQQGPIAQIAFGHTPNDKDAALTLTVLLPVSIAFDKPPKLGPGAGADDPGSASLTYRRCLPGGCLADAKPDTTLLKELRGAGKPGHLSFTDAAERTITLPVSFRGLAQALDDLAKETGKEAAR
jgi:invasion protein IalB